MRRFRTYGGDGKLARLTRQLSITGHVQGVGFRWALSQKAKTLQLAGWVRNRRDGSVEALVSGEPAAVEALCAWAAHGPSAARVERVLCNDLPEPYNSDPESGFTRRATL